MSRVQEPAWRQDLPGVLDAIAEKLRAAYSAEDIDEKLAELINDMGDPSAGQERLNSYAQPRSTPVDGTSPLEGPKQIIEGLLKDREKVAFALGHSSASGKRGWPGLPQHLKEKHRDKFVELALEVLAALRVADGTTFRDLPFNLLIVDNAPHEIEDYDEMLPPGLGLVFWRQCRPWIYQVKDEASIEELLRAVRENDFDNRLKPLGFSEEDHELAFPKPSEFDLILQDEFLRTGVDGLQLAELYFEHMPQALVFLTTGVEVANVTSLTHSRAVDRILPKNRLAAVPWYYYIAFADVLGQMFWPSWLEANEEGPYLQRRSTLRQLFGTIRRWLREPEILWHGQALAEMVDHGHEHISDLWNLTRQILGAADENGELLIPLDKVTTAERVLVTLSVWLHDMGHRGDEFCTGPEDIRSVHGSISERLLLEDPSAFALGWMLDGKGAWSQRQGQDEESRAERLKQRNYLPSSGTTIGQGSEDFHPLRAVGLLCRHHQSSAPLFRASLARLHFALKFPSDYARVGYGPDGDTAVNGDEALESWRSDEQDLEWEGFGIRTLEDFSAQVTGIDFLKCGCLLRLFDAINLTKRRAGSRARLATHRQYRRQRKRWVKKRLSSLRQNLAKSSVGSRPYLRSLEEIFQLEKYLDLLEVQDVHLWRQRAVESWNVRARQQVIDVTYQIIPTIMWKEEKDFVDFRDALTAYYEKKAEAKDWSWYDSDELTTWRANFIDDCIASEVGSQKRPGATKTFLANNVFSAVDLVMSIESEGKEPIPIYSLRTGEPESVE